MTRQQRRAELREVDKNLKKAIKTKAYAEMTRYFATLSKEDLMLLKDKKHEDPKAQAKYEQEVANMRYLISLQARAEFLRAPKSKTEQSPDQAELILPH